MDYIEGQTLEDCVQKSLGNKLPFQRVLHFATQLCIVLDYLHSQQPPIIFRDLKPANVMVTSDDHLYLIDFGIARLFKLGQAKDTTVLGSPGYAAPEQYGKAQTTERADVYSLGATLHRLLSGQDPSENPFHFSPLDLTQEAPTGPVFAKLIERMLEIDAQKWPPSVQAIRQNLQRLAQQLDMSSSTTNTSTNVPAPLSVHYRALFPQSTVDDYINQSIALNEKGRYQQALDAREQALRLDPNLAKAHLSKKFLRKKLWR